MSIKKSIAIYLCLYLKKLMFFYAISAFTDVTCPHYFVISVNATLVALSLSRTYSNAALKGSEVIREFFVTLRSWVSISAFDGGPLCSHVDEILRAGRREICSTEFKTLSCSMDYHGIFVRNIFSVARKHSVDTATAGIPRHIIKNGNQQFYESILTQTL